MPSQKRAATDTVAQAGKKAKDDGAQGGKAPKERPVFERTETPRRCDPSKEDERHFKAMAWNVAGLRPLLNNAPEALTRLVEKEKPDLLCLIETKLQEAHKEEFGGKLQELLPQYSRIWNFSTAKKGYSGLVVLMKKQEGKAKEAKAIIAKHKDLGIPALTKDYNAEGRVISFELEKAWVVFAYVPNSGMDLKRLDYRIGDWERDMCAFLSKLQEDKPVIYGGDFNVAHLDDDIWNVDAKHIPKSAGTTPAERRAFGEMLESVNLVDAFRHYHPEAKGAFTYWSVRAGNRPYNRGLRLDYFVCSESLLTEEGNGGVKVIDAWHDPDVPKGDHCPVGITFAL